MTIHANNHVGLFFKLTHHNSRGRLTLFRFLIMIILAALPAVVMAERVVVEKYGSLSVKPGDRCDRDSSYFSWKKANGVPQAQTNHFFIDYLIYDGTNCVQPPSCDTWSCPRKAVPKEWNSFSLSTRTSKRRNNAEALLDDTLRHNFNARQASYETRASGTATLVRQGKTLLTGTLDQAIAEARTGDHIELGKGVFTGAGFTKAPDGLTVIGQGPETVLRGVSALPAHGHWFQDMSIVNPSFEQTFYSEGRTNIFVRVHLDLFDNFGSLGGRGIDSIVTLLGSFGQLRPMNIHLLPPRAFGTHVATLNEYGEMYDHYALPDSLPDGPLRQWLLASIPKGKPLNVEKALKASAWKTLPDIDDTSSTAILAWKTPANIDAGLAISISAIRSWLKPASGDNSAEDPAIAAVMADLDAKRPLSALLRTARAQSSDFMVADRLVSLNAEARKTIANIFGCNVNLVADTKQRGPQNASLRWDNVPYDETLWQLGWKIPERQLLELIPPARFAGTNLSRDCEFTTTLGIDAWQYEKTVGQARIEKTEWYLSEQGLAKGRAALNAGLSNLGQSFEAAASSIESTWQNFDAYRTRIETTQTGDQYLLSYQGDRNAGNRKGFDELERLRRQANNQAGPGAAGDYYPMTTYVVDASQKFRHYIEFSMSGKLSGTTVWSSGPKVIDMSWDGTRCQDRFIDNSVELRTGGTDCFLSNGYKGTAQLGQMIQTAFSGFLHNHLQARIEATTASQRKSALKEDQAEAVLLAIMMKRPLAANDHLLLKTVFGEDITPESAGAILQAASKQ